MRKKAQLSTEKNIGLPEDIFNSKDAISRFEEDYNQSEPIRELFTAKNIKLKTELNVSQRSDISVLYSVYENFKRIGIELEQLKNVLDQFVIFGVPLDRKGRDEYVQAHQQYLNQQQQTMNNQSVNNPANIKRL